MSYRASFTAGKAASVVAGVLFLSIPGCTHATRPAKAAAGTSPAFVAAGGRLISNFYNTARSVFENETVSLALDRIDQRDLPLDRTYRRRGTGQGVTVYVFDGGIMATHPELAGRVRKGYDAFDGD